MGLFSGPGVTPSLKGAVSNVISLQAAQVYPLTPAGWYNIQLGLYTVLQEYDPITQMWRTIGGGTTGGSVQFIYSDGVNYRLANQSGCAVGALITNAGTGYTSAPVVTPSTGGSIWRAIIGGAISTTITVNNSGSGYVYAPQVTISAPPPGGIQATAYAALSAGTITVTVVDQGAGYVTAPTVVLSNDPREGQNGLSSGSGAVATATLTGAGTITGLVCVDHGTALTAIPTLAFSGGGGASGAATTIMNWAITGITAGTAGAGVAGAVVRITAEDNFPATAPAYRNVSTQSKLVRTRNADILAPTSSNGVTATGAVVYDGGCYTSAPTVLVLATASIITTAPVVTCAVGGLPDVSVVLTT